MSKLAVKSQMQTGSLASRRLSAIWSRVGSARAFRISLVCSIFSGRVFSVGGQQTPRSRSGSTACRASADTRAELARRVAAERGCCGTADWSLHDEGDKLRVTVRASSGACCDDDACGATYSAAELASVGIDPTASLGCGNPA